MKKITLTCDWCGKNATCYRDDMIQDYMKKHLPAYDICEACAHRWAENMMVVEAVERSPDPAQTAKNLLEMYSRPPGEWHLEQKEKKNA